ncbi:MAG: phenylalanine--tRNA ligase subunit beta, partial [Patescibacteria group bacterium]
KVAETLLMHAFEVEGMEKKGSDTIFSIDVLPNRIADASGHLGMARELAALLKKSLKLPKFEVKESKELVSRFLKVEVRDKEACPRYVARYAHNIKVAPSPAWLKERLEACGINSLNNIVDITNYVMLYFGQPLHAFDADKVESGIVVRCAKAGEKFVSLDGDEHTLTKEDLLIADTEGPLALAGIKGGKRAEVTRETKKIILESANFSPEGIERTAKRANLLTDAAIRFRVGIDTNLTVEAVDMAASLIQTIAGGEVLKGRVDTGKNVPARPVKLRLTKAQSVLGFAISEKEIFDILERLGAKIAKTGSEYKVTMPTARVDIKVEEDLIEVLARVYGLYRITPKAPLVTFSESGEMEKDNFRERLSERLAGLGYSEIMSYAFLGSKELDLLEDASSVLRLVNPLRPELSSLRPALSLSALSALALNLKHADEVRFFEIGAAFRKPAKTIHDSAELEDERILLAFASKKQNTEPYYELKGALSAIMESFGIRGMYFDDAPEGRADFKKYYRELYHPFRSAQIKYDGHIVGIIGELHPAVREGAGIKGNAGVVELSFDAFFKAASRERDFEEISKYPAASRALAILVPLHTRAEQVLDI